jgi:hypothetical protein
MLSDLLQAKRVLLIGPPMSFAFHISQSLVHASPRKRIIWITQSDDDGRAMVHSFKQAYTTACALSYISTQVAECSTLVRILQRTIGDDDTIVVKELSRAAPLFEGYQSWLTWQSEIAELPSVRVLTVASYGPEPASVRPSLPAKYFDRTLIISDGHPTGGAIPKERRGILVRVSDGTTSHLLRGTSRLGTVLFDIEKEPANV